MSQVSSSAVFLLSTGKSSFVLRLGRCAKSIPVLGFGEAVIRADYVRQPFQYSAFILEPKVTNAATKPPRNTMRDEDENVVYCDLFGGCTTQRNLQLHLEPR